MTTSTPFGRVRPGLASGRASIAVLLGALAACSDAAAPPVAARLEAAAELTQTAAVATAVSSAPAVRVLSADGQPVAGATVTFRVTSGGGTLASPTVSTGPGGLASAGSWTLGTVAGSQTVVAEAPGLAPVTFSATALAGPAAALVAESRAQDQTARTGAMVPVAPGVVVRDAHGNPVAGAEVTFEIGSGGGSVVGAQATSGADGVAAAGGWKLGVVPGTQTLTARSGALQATITATATLPSGCGESAAYEIGATIQGTWETADCVSAGGRDVFDVVGSRYDVYELVLTEATRLRASVTGPAGRGIRIRRKTGGSRVGLMPGPAFIDAQAPTLHLEYVLEAGSYLIEVQAPDATARGTYTIATALDDDTTCRPIVFGTLDVTVQDALDPETSCPDPGFGGYEDWLVMILEEGDRLRLTLTTTTFRPFLAWRDDREGPASPTLATASLQQPGTVTIEWTATFSGFYEAVVWKGAGAGGPYTLKIERLP